MAGWDFAYKAGPPGGTLTDLSDFASVVRIPAESATGKRGSNPIVQYRQGEYPSPRKFTRASEFLLETHLRYTDSAGAITDPDGSPGEVFAAKAGIAQLLGGQVGKLARLQRTAPHQGVVYRDVEMLGDAIPSQADYIFGWPLHSPWPFWIGAADLANVPPTLTVAGDAPIANAIIRLTGAGTDAKLVVDSTGDFVQIVGALPAGGVEIDVNAASASRITGGTDYSNFLRMTSGWELSPGANAVTLTGGGAAAIDWNTQWR